MRSTAAVTARRAARTTSGPIPSPSIIGMIGSSGTRSLSPAMTILWPSVGGFNVSFAMDPDRACGRTFLSADEPLASATCSSGQARPALPAESKVHWQSGRPAGRTRQGWRPMEEFRAVRTRRAVVRLPFLDEGPHPLERLPRREVQCEPVPRMADGHGPGEVLPEIHLLFRVPEAFRELVNQLVRDLAGLRIELLAGDDPVHEAPLKRLCRRHPLAQVQHLPGAAVSNEERQPLRRSPRRNGPHP